MKSRERVRRLLARQPVDRIPNGLGGCETAGLHILAYDKLKKVLGVDDPRTRMYTFMTNAVAEPSVLNAIQGDIIVLNSRMCPSSLWGEGSERQWKKTEFWGKEFEVPVDWSFSTKQDGTIVWDTYNWRCPPGGIYFDPDPAVSMTSMLVDDINITPDDYNPPHEIPEEKLRALENAARTIYESTDFAICCGETIEDLQVQPGGTTAWWMMLADKPDMAREFLHKACEAGISQLKQLDQAVGKYADMLAIAHDLGDVRGVTIGPGLFRKIYKPYYKKLFTEWHKITNMKISMHSCGSVFDIIGDLIECGMDVLNPVQISARGMKPEVLKEKFGNDLIFYGGCFDAVLMPKETPAEQVYEEVKHNIMAFSKGGGYIFAGVHNMPGDTPESHIKAVLDAYYDCRYQ